MSIEKTSAGPVECFMLSDAEVSMLVDSEFVDGYQHKKVIGHMCPQCKNLLPPFEHGEYKNCIYCGVWLYSVGNALFVSWNPFRTGGHSRKDYDSAYPRYDRGGTYPRHSEGDNLLGTALLIVGITFVALTLIRIVVGG